MITIDRYYMCHYSKLVDRKEYIIGHIKQFNIELKWITDFDKENIDFENISLIYPKITELMPQFGRKMTKPEISLCMKHISVFKDVIDNNLNNVVVFEDDIILCEEFSNKINRYLEELPDDYDILWIGTCCNLHANTIPNKHIYHGRGSRCTHAYLISKKACEKMIDNLKFLNSPIDWYFNFVIEKERLKNFWAEPALSIQDLKFESAINAGKIQ